MEIKQSCLRLHVSIIGNTVQRVILVFLTLFVILQLTAQSNLPSNDWAAFDGLGRELKRYDSQVPKEKKTVILFYWTWHQQLALSDGEVKNISQIISRQPEAMLNRNHPEWRTNNPTNHFYWDEPLLGYYRTTDHFVLRKHAEWLADAGVDAVMFDCTNGSLTWDESTEALLSVWSQALKDGVNVPKIGFMLPFGANHNSLISLRHLYHSIYEKGRYSELWFRWEGKPCIMAYPDNLSLPEDQAILDFFTFRPGQPDYVNGPKPNRNDQWGWLENYPQKGYVKKRGGRYELVTVGVAQNACPETRGHCSAFNKPGAYTRSFTQQRGYDVRDNAYLYGANFEEQWSRAFQLNPKAVFITGWNEWIAGMWGPEHGWTGYPFSFVDEFDWDHSRDIEPVKAWQDNGDCYYMQMVNNIRRFKGTTPPQSISPTKHIRLQHPEDWNDVLPVYSDYKGDVMHRNAQGNCGIIYTDSSGRNDIVESRVARDSKYVYFRCITNNALTPCSDSHWMMLLINADRSNTTGWQGYNYIVNLQSPDTTKGKAFIQANGYGQWYWRTPQAIDFYLEKNAITLKIPRSMLCKRGQKLDIEFKWVDNMQHPGNIMDFYVSGDVAPSGRFNYVYSEK